MDIGRIGRKGEINKYDSYSPVESPRIKIRAIAVRKPLLILLRERSRLKALAQSSLNTSWTARRPALSPLFTGVVVEIDQYSIIILAREGGLVVSKRGG